MSETGKRIIAERNDPYADASSVHGMILKDLAVPLNKLLVTVPPIFFPWNLILNKLLRVFGSPLHRDHWVDIQGYAQLVINFIDQIEAARAAVAAEEEVLAQKEKNRAAGRKGAATRRRNRSKKLSKET